MLKKATAVILCVALISAFLVLPAYAAAPPPVYDCSDYISHTYIDETQKKVTFTFDGLTPYTYILPNDGSGAVTLKGETVRWTPNIGETGFYGQVSPLGVKNWNASACQGGSIFIGDIIAGASVDIECSFDMTFVQQAFNQVDYGSQLVVTPRWGADCFGSNGEFINIVYATGEKIMSIYSTTGFDFDYTGTFIMPALVKYIVPWIDMTCTFPAVENECWVQFDVDPFSFSTSINMIYEQSQTMDAINEKLGEIGDKLDDTNDKLDDLLQHPEQEKQDASTGGDANVGELTGAIPDYSQGFVEALTGLAASMSYEGTDAVLPIPAIDFPQIGGLIAGFRMLEPTELDFGVFIQMMPGALLLLVQSLFTIALIVYCFKELYSVISYFLTLKGGGS